MKSISFILGFFLLIISIGCNEKLDIIQPVETKGAQIYLPLINESELTAIPEENFDSDLQYPILTITETPNEELNLETPAPAPTINKLESEINPIIIPFEGIRNHQFQLDLPAQLIILIDMEQHKKEHEFLMMALNFIIQVVHLFLLPQMESFILPVRIMQHYMVN